MNRKEIFEYLQEGGLWYADYDGDECKKYVMISCPLAKFTHEGGRDDNPSMAVYVNGDNEMSFYKCYACNHKGPFWKLFKVLGMYENNLDLIDLAREVKKADGGSVESRLKRSVKRYDKKPSGTTIKSLTALEKYFDKQLKPCGDEVKQYLKKRKVDEGVVSAFDLKYDIAGRVVIPIRTQDGKFVGCEGRALKDNADLKVKTYWSTKKEQALGKRFMLFPKTYIILVEGMFDMFKTWTNLKKLELQDKFNVVCSFTARLSQYQVEELEEYGKTVICFYDNDKAGHQGWNGFKDYDGVQKMLKGIVPRTIRIEPPIDKDAGDMDAEELGELLERQKLTLKK